MTNDVAAIEASVDDGEHSQRLDTGLDEEKPMKPSETPCFFWKASLYFVRSAITAVMVNLVERGQDRSGLAGPQQDERQCADGCRSCVRASRAGRWFTGSAPAEGGSGDFGFLRGRRFRWRRGRLLLLQVGEDVFLGDAPLAALPCNWRTSTPASATIWRPPATGPFLAEAVFAVTGSLSVLGWLRLALRVDAADDTADRHGLAFLHADRQHAVRG